MYNKNNSFFKLGKTLILGTNTDAFENAIYDEAHVGFQQKYAAILSNILNSVPETKGSESSFLLKKVASTSFENWNDTCENILDCCTKILIEQNISKNTFAKYASFAEIGLKAGTLPLAIASRAGGMGLPLLGAVGGGLSWLAEKELTEDDVKSEILKAQIKEYRALAATIEKQLREQYGYKTLEELEAEEQDK